jgi:hypothetical protein
MSGPGARQSTNLVSGQRVRSLALMCPAISCVTDRDGGRSQEVDLAGMTIVYASDGQEHLPLIERYLVDGRQRVEDFFGSPFRMTFMVRIFPDRATRRSQQLDDDVNPSRDTRRTGNAETELFANWGQHLLRGSG